MPLGQLAAAVGQRERVCLRATALSEARPSLAPDIRLQIIRGHQNWQCRRITATATCQQEHIPRHDRVASIILQHHGREQMLSKVGGIGTSTKCSSLLSVRCFTSMCSSKCGAPSWCDTTFVIVSLATWLVNSHLSTHPCSNFSTVGTAEEGKKRHQRERHGTHLD